MYKEEGQKQGRNMEEDGEDRGRRRRKEGRRGGKEVKSTASAKQGREESTSCTTATEPNSTRVQGAVDGREYRECEGGEA